MSSDSPAALRNREPITEALTSIVQGLSRALEIASGRGTHVEYFSARFPNIVWQPSEYESDAVQALSARVAQLEQNNVRTPIQLDAASDWAETFSDWQPQLIFAANMVHISPFMATVGLLRGAARLLDDSGRLVLYGPYQLGGEHTSPGNAAFHDDLQARNPDWGIRDLDDVLNAAADVGLVLANRIEMPANNQLLAFKTS